MAGSTDTTYGNGGVNMTAQGSPFGFNSNGMDLSGAARFAQQMAMQQMGFRDRQMRLQEDEFGLRKGQVNRGNQLEDTDRERARSEQLRAMMQLRQPEGEAMYVKPMTGMNMSGGYGQAQPWEQGSAFAGYRQPGSGARASSFGPPNPAQGQVNMGGPNIGQPAQGPPQQGGEDSMASRYFKQFGDIPPWLRPQSAG